MTIENLFAGIDLKTWVGLSCLNGVGAGRLNKLATYLLHLDSANSPAQEISAELLKQLGWPKDSIGQALYGLNGRWGDNIQRQIDDTFAWLAHSRQHQILLPSSPAYPPILKAIPVAPVTLYVRGSVMALSPPAIGIVGARRASPYGRDVAQSWAQQLAEAGICPISGGAMGIDTCVHQGALNARQATIAVMGTGLQALYPRQNHHLFEQIVDTGGALVSEYPLKTQARPQLFPPRNRIISGLSYGILVVEASAQSGSLISARYGLEHNREVMAIPGRIYDTNAGGTNLLIRQGAALVTSVEEVLNELPRECRDLMQNLHQNQSPAKPQQTELLFASNEQHAPHRERSDQAVHWDFSGYSKSERQVLQCLTDAAQGMDFDELVRATQCHVPSLMQQLMSLELTGVITNQQGMYRLQKH
ncbi:DNA-processing protein DprA [Maribrevibacterium harenarium]|nr:DNA-processing protein DprA [Maribrevibacterium harenarium]